MPSIQKKIFSKQVLSQLTNIRVLTTAFALWGESIAVPTMIIADLSLVLDELLTNIIEHGYHGKTDGQIQLRARLNQHCLILTLCDYAVAFNPCLMAVADTTADLETRQIGGLGIHFVRLKTDRLLYRRLNLGKRQANHLEIWKCWDI